MAVGDKLVLTMNTVASSMSGFPAQNVFAYENTIGAGSAAHLAATFDAQIAVPLKALLSNLCMISQYYTINLDNPSDFDLTLVAQVGAAAGDILPPFCGFAFRYARNTREVNDGRKTFGLVPEAAWSGTALQSTWVTAVPAFATTLGSALTAGGITYIPRIWRRAGNYKLGGISMAFPDTFYEVKSVQFKTVSSQNTRKR